MSELINAGNGRNKFHRQLLTTASALALIGNICSALDAKADSDTDRPTAWIELGGQLEQQMAQTNAYVPSFVTGNLDSPAFKPVSPSSFQKSPLFTNGAEAELTFEPTGTDWVFSASVRYGRSTGQRKFQQTHRVTNTVQTTLPYRRHYTAGGRIGGSYGTGGYYGPHRIKKNTAHQYASQTAGGQIKQSESHAIVDFTVGKDVGLGMFGGGSTSSFNVGVRFAQFASKASGTIDARPNPKFIAAYNTFDQRRHGTQFPSAVFRHPAQGRTYFIMPRFKAGEIFTA